VPRRAVLAAVVLAAVIASAAPSIAQAGWKTDRAVKIAQIVWHPSCGQLRVAYSDPTMSGAPDEAGGWAWAGDCGIGVDSRKHWEFEMLCQIILHEGGHVAGLGHSTNPASVMRASFLGIKTTAVINGRTYTRWDGIDSRCLNGGRRFLLAHGAL
jgi:hypothetical protein